MQKQATAKRLTGTVVPVGALRGKGSLGVGEFPDLADFAGLCKKMGLGLIQLLPVNDTGFESSPYSSLTAFGLHPLYLRIEDLEEYGSIASAIKEKIANAGQIFERDVRFHHQKILQVKMEVLRSIFAANKAAITKKADAKGKLAVWIGNNPWVKEYAVYRNLKEENGEKSWRDWKDNQKVSAADIETLWNDKKRWEKHLFWAWLQEALDTQFQKAAKAVTDAGLLLEGDLPILMNEDSCDVWAHPDIFIQELSAGAPPDMYSPDGQNWGFPIYNWEAQAKTNYAWWRQRLAVAGKYYQAYRIDHVLGFFRIWASSRADYTSALGRFVPYSQITTAELTKHGLDKGRIRWFSQPHIPTGEIWDALRNKWTEPHSEEDVANAAKDTFSRALDQIGNEELWLFKSSIKGEKDIIALGLHPICQNYLFEAWHNRILLEYEAGKFAPVWYYHKSRAYMSLNEADKKSLEKMLEDHLKKSEKIWATEGKKLLSVLVESSPMLPCAEDLGAVPECVPKVLGELGILGLRVVRWFRNWEEKEQPYIPFDEYPELSVCTPAVHDSSTVREWWETEAEQELFSGFIGYPSLPRIYNPSVARTILLKTAGAKSRFRVFQIQDLLHLSSKWYAKDASSERINVPGTSNEFNWTYRLPASIDEIGQAADLIKAVAELNTSGK